MVLMCHCRVGAFGSINENWKLRLLTYAWDLWSGSLLHSRNGDSRFADEISNWAVWETLETFWWLPDWCGQTVAMIHTLKSEQNFYIVITLTENAKEMHVCQWKVCWSATLSFKSRPNGYIWKQRLWMHTALSCRTFLGSQMRNNSL